MLRIDLPFFMSEHCDSDTNSTNFEDAGIGQALTQTPSSCIGVSESGEQTDQEQTPIAAAGVGIGLVIDEEPTTSGMGVGLTEEASQLSSAESRPILDNDSVHEVHCYSNVF